jgi:hypothetical protein
MPIPQKNADESQKKFLARCMSNTKMNEEYPNETQRYAVCMNQTKSSLLEQVCEIIEENSLGFEEDELTPFNFIVPEEDQYVDFEEETEELDFNTIAAFIYKDPITNELYYYQRQGVYTKNGRNLVFVSKAAEYQGKKVTLNKPFRTPDGPKKFSVYVKNDKGNVVKVNFGDPNMKIKKNIPERRKSFRARHNCDNPGPKWKARYWSCKAW